MLGYERMKTYYPKRGEPVRYHIDTIPVWDAIKLKGECPLCALRRKNELIEIQRFLGASVMEPDSRIEVNANGFCTHHQTQLFAEKNRLGLALLMDSHIRELEKKVSKLLKQAKRSADEQGGASAFKRILGGSNGSGNELTAASTGLRELAESCILCDSLNENMDRYSFTFIHLWKTDSEFRKSFATSRGLCIPDCAKLLSMAQGALSANELPEFVGQMADLLEQNLKRLEEELEWFTLKFDYRNNDKPWNNSKDALERTINKLRGWCVGEEPNPKT